MPLRVCMEPHCPTPASYRGRCKDHARLNDKSIGRAGRQIYKTKRWGILRRHKLSLNPMCEHEGCEALATDVHHRHGVEADPWALEGLEALCASHHSARTRVEQVRRATERVKTNTSIDFSKEVRGV